VVILWRKTQTRNLGVTADNGTAARPPNVARVYNITDTKGLVKSNETMESSQLTPLYLLDAQAMVDLSTLHNEQRAKGERKNWLKS